MLFNENYNDIFRKEYYIMKEKTKIGDYDRGYNFGVFVSGTGLIITALIMTAMDIRKAKKEQK
jgi:hypothetical protein